MGTVLQYRKKETMPFLGDRMRDVRKLRGLTQVQLAQRLKIKQYRISEYEHNKAEPGANLLGDIAKELAIPADFLLGLVDTMEVVMISRSEFNYLNRLRASSDPNATLDSEIHAFINDPSHK